MQRLTAENIDNIEMFFIVGRIRSGTTLLTNVLNSHEDIFIPQESPFILYLFNRYHKVSVWDEDKVISFLKDLWKEYRLTQFWTLNEHKEKLLTFLTSLNFEEITFERLCKLVILFQARREGKYPKIIGDKNPSYTLYMPLLKHIFPRAKFVSLVRDPRSNILSCKRVTFDSNNTVILAVRWNACLDSITDFDTYESECHLTVEYEQLLSEPEKWLTKICTHLELIFHENLLEFYKVDKMKESWKYFKLQNFDKAKIDEWKTKLKSEDLELIQKICRKHIIRMNYEFSESTSPALFKLPKVYLNIVIGKSLNLFEKIIYFFPLEFKAWIIDQYRVATKTKS